MNTLKVVTATKTEPTEVKKSDCCAKCKGKSNDTCSKRLLHIQRKEKDFQDTNTFQQELTIEEVVRNAL